VTGLKFLYKAAAAGAPPDAIAPANRSGSSSLQHTAMSLSYLSKIIAAVWHPLKDEQIRELALRFFRSAG
jgi:hypothetical protein